MRWPLKSLIDLPVRFFTVLSAVMLVGAASGCIALPQNVLPSPGLIATLPAIARATQASPATSQTTDQPTAPIRPSGSAVPFWELARGFRLGSTQPAPAVLLAEDAQSLEVLRARIDAGDRDALQTVDLEREALLGAFWGVRPAGGSSITIRSIQISGEELVLEVSLNEIDPDFPRIEAITSPYHLVIVDKDVFKGGRLRYRMVSAGTLLAEGRLP